MFLSCKAFSSAVGLMIPTEKKFLMDLNASLFFGILPVTASRVCPRPEAPAHRRYTPFLPQNIAQWHMWPSTAGWVGMFGLSLQQDHWPPWPGLASFTLGAPTPPSSPHSTDVTQTWSHRFRQVPVTRFTGWPWKAGPPLRAPLPPSVQRRDWER